MNVSFHWPDWWKLWPIYHKDTGRSFVPGFASELVWNEHLFCFGPLQVSWLGGVNFE